MPAVVSGDCFWSLRHANSFELPDGVTEQSSACSVGILHIDLRKSHCRSARSWQRTDSMGDRGLCNLQQSIITKGLSGTPLCQAQWGLLIEETVKMHREVPSIRTAALHQLETEIITQQLSVGSVQCWSACVRFIFSHLTANLMTTIRADCPLGIKAKDSFGNLCNNDAADRRTRVPFKQWRRRRKSYKVPVPIIGTGTSHMRCQVCRHHPSNAFGGFCFREEIII